jgi:hypothetical protein
MRLVIPVMLAVLLATAGSAAAQLTNPGFDSGPAGMVGNFGTVVGPPFQAGFWGAEDASITNATICGTGPLSNPYMLELGTGGGAYSQAWQAVDVSAGPPAVVNFRAWANNCASAPGVTVGLDIRTFNNANGWPTHTMVVSTSIQLDADVNTWEQVLLDCVQIPADTDWILAQVYLVNSTAGGNPAYFDDVTLEFDHCIVPVEPTTWGTIKALYATPSE